VLCLLCLSLNTQQALKCFMAKFPCCIALSAWSPRLRQQRPMYAAGTQQMCPGARQETRGGYGRYFETVAALATKLLFYICSIARSSKRSFQQSHFTASAHDHSGLRTVVFLVTNENSVAYRFEYDNVTYTSFKLALCRKQLYAARALIKWNSTESTTTEAAF
jgi:hypothetical protein